MKNRFYLNTFYDDSHKLNVEKWLSSKQKIVASLAPSYLAEFDTDPHKVAGALRKLGIFEVEETVTVLPQIAEARQKLVDNSSKPIIFGSCPVIRKIIEDNFSNLKRFLCCLPSPMVLHGQTLKQKFPQSKVIFIGPCFAKQKEEIWFYKKQTIDAVITFKDLRSLFKKNNINIEKSRPRSFLSTPEKWARFGPLIYYKTGLDDIVQLFKQWDCLELKEKALELLACRGGCLMGPGMTTNKALKERVELFNKLFK